MRRTFMAVYVCLFYGAWLTVWNPVRAQEPELASKVYTDSSKSVLLLIVKSEDGDVVSQGTGFIVEGGKILTNEHVVRDGRVFVDLGAVQLPASVERIDSFNDLALLTISSGLLASPLPLAEVSPNPGSSVFAIGNPAGLERSISTGVVSGVRDFEGRKLLQITAPISPGSSGGPILNGRGEVVGIAVGIFKDGQNLNFAVPSVLVRKLLADKVQAADDIVTLANLIDELLERRTNLGYNSDPKSDWNKLNQQIQTILLRLMDVAKDDPKVLLAISEKFLYSNTDIAVEAATRAVSIVSSVQAQVMLARSLDFKAMLSEEGEKSALRDRSESAIRAAFRMTGQPTFEMYYLLGDILENQGSFSEAESNFRRALQLGREENDVEKQADSMRGLVRIAYSLGKREESIKWFESLVSTKKATAWDWQQNGKRMDEDRQFLQAGISYQRAALAGGAWTNWCEAAGSFALVSGESDMVLECARKCIAEGSDKKGSEVRVSNAHIEIAGILNDRGVYQEALSHAREASALDATNPWALNSQARSLLGLQRYREAANVSTQAIRISDGKYSSMHFNLGSAYFEVENWELARQSYEKAAQLDSKDSAAPYNVALCMVRLRYYSDAANWYEEVLRREPNHRNRREILTRIISLRQ